MAAALHWNNLLVDGRQKLTFYQEFATHTLASKNPVITAAAAEAAASLPPAQALPQNTLRDQGKPQGQTIVSLVKKAATQATYVMKFTHIKSMTSEYIIVMASREC